jgi:hypothetical protein
MVNFNMSTPFASMHRDVLGLLALRLLSSLSSASARLKITTRMDSMSTTTNARDGAMDVVDLNTVQCLVGRVWVPLLKQWAIVDRSGQLARVQWDEDE